MKLYCSTGVFIGRINDCNYKLIADAAEVVDCDGFEFMIFDDWTDELIDISHYLKDRNINIPVVHADKDMGAAISSCTRDSHKIALDKLILNCKAASVVEAEYVLVHPWGYPDSDKYLDKIIDFIPELMDVCDVFNVKLLIEAVVANVNDPLYDIKKVIDKFPEVRITIDTRHLAYHGKLEQLYNEKELFSNIEHVHVSDYRGNPMDWTNMRPVLAPGEGEINFAGFFDFLKSINYNKGITLESANIKALGVDAEAINNNLEFIRQLV